MKWLHFFVLALSSLMFTHVGLSNASVNTLIDTREDCYKVEAIKDAVNVSTDLIVTATNSTFKECAVNDVGKTLGFNYTLTSNTTIDSTSTFNLERNNLGTLALFKYRGHDLVIEHLELSERIQTTYWHLEYKHKLLRSCIKNC